MRTCRRPRRQAPLFWRAPLRARPRRRRPAASRCGAWRACRQPISFCPVRLSPEAPLAERRWPRACHRCRRSRHRPWCRMRMRRLSQGPVRPALQPVLPAAMQDPPALPDQPILPDPPILPNPPALARVCQAGPVVRQSVRQTIPRSVRQAVRSLALPGPCGACPLLAGP